MTLFLITVNFLCALHRNMVLAERCALLSAEILKSQAKYSDAATLLIKMTSEVRKSTLLTFVANTSTSYLSIQQPTWSRQRAIYLEPGSFSRFFAYEKTGFTHDNCSVLAHIWNVRSKN